MGWSGGGLGKQGEGIVKPIEVKQRPECAGIAFSDVKEKTKQAKEEARRRGEQWGDQIIVDATGKEYSSLSAALAKHAVPTNDSTQLIEIRHNLRLICDGNSKALDLLANEGSAIQDRRKWLERKLHEAVRRKQNLVTKHDRVETIAKIVREIELLGKRAAIDPKIGLDSLMQPVQDILQRHRDAIAEMEIDAALVGAITPIFKRELSQWSSLQDPTRLCIPLKSISGALRISVKDEIMMPYQSLLWNVWMPPVRSALNNEWDVFGSTAVTKFYESWTPLLPAFIRDNVTHQLILPKLRSAVSDWDGKSVLYKVVFPWMPLLHHQIDDIILESKRRIRSSLKSWRVSEGIPSELRKWRDVFRTSEWDSMLLEYVVEKLSTYLRVELKITASPRAQDR
ncbi:TFP11-domain-containing protein [Meira miltonrushii]|uniref:TFP11-domain-containing protein n=1 Tax=Meira miltonrushii TaxID=1280837 RepID=A0A316V783_9BASI|nr:TFP11-domain-containing protein [Meira miltonrushii]PWN32361.1 TFP11-domain-containing protein [Meira miltonrushii]